MTYRPGPNAVTVAVNFYGYSGGAHGYAATNCTLVDLRTGKAVGPDGVFAAGDKWLKAMVEIVGADLKKQFVEKPGFEEALEPDKPRQAAARARALLLARQPAGADLQRLRRRALRGRPVSRSMCPTTGWRRLLRERRADHAIGAAMSRSVHVPAGIFDSRQYGFAQVAIVPTPFGSAVHVSGQVAWDADQQYRRRPGDIGRQAREKPRKISRPRWIRWARNSTRSARCELYIKQSHIAEGKAMAAPSRRCRRQAAVFDLDRGAQPRRR